MNIKFLMSASLIAMMGIIGFSTVADAACKRKYRPSKLHFRNSTPRKPAASRFQSPSRSHMELSHTARTAAVERRFRQVWREIEVRQARVKTDKNIPVPVKEFLLARLSALKSQLKSEQLVRDNSSVIHSELRKIDLAMKTQATPASGRRAYS